jgi:hypothetical protein
MRVEHEPELNHFSYVHFAEELMAATRILRFGVCWMNMPALWVPFV